MKWWLSKKGKGIGGNGSTTISSTFIFFMGNKDMFPLIARGRRKYMRW